MRVLRRHSRIALLLASAAAALGLAGCGGEGELNTEYGVRRSPRGAGSVSGVGVLADMFEQRGHRVSTFRHLSPKIRENDVIIWAPDDLTPPSEEVRTFLEDWLYARDGRTLVYIGRDYFPELDYWKAVRKGASPELVETVQRRLARASLERDSRREALPEKGPKYARWFTLVPKPARQVRQVSGEWVERLRRQGTPIDEEKLDIRLAARLRPPTPKEMSDKKEQDQLVFKELLTSDGDALVYRVGFAEGFVPPSPEAEEEDDGSEDEPDDVDYYYDDEPLFEDEYEFEFDDYGYGEAKPRTPDSQILVAANGSFLLNLPLVNPQHRLLAGELIEQCEYREELQVAVLETGAQGAPVYLEEPNPLPSYLKLLTVWPLNVILLHALALGILVCFFFAPIFGRPIDRRIQTVVEGRPIFVSIGSETTGPSDFGRHIEALGELMSRTGDVQYAHARLQHYEQYVRRDSGVSHKKPPPPVTPSAKPPLAHSPSPEPPAGNASAAAGT
jgi:hypothetical protein